MANNAFNGSLSSAGSPSRFEGVTILSAGLIAALIVFGPVLNARIERIVIQHIITPAALSLPDAGKALDKLDGGNPLRHFVAQLAFNPEAQRRAVVQRERFLIHFIRQDRLRFS